MDSKSSFGLGNTRLGNAFSNIRSEILNISTAFQTAFNPQLDVAKSKVSEISASLKTTLVDLGKVHQGGGGAGGGGGGTGGPNQIAQRPPSMGAYALGAYAAANQALPGTTTSVQQDYLTSRAVFYGMGAATASNRQFGGLIGQDPTSLGAQYKAVNNLQNQLNRAGTITSTMDATQALARAQSLGLAGATNFNQVMMGAAAMSNITPGIGIEGSVRTYGAMQQARNVNMLRGIGIQIRGADGSMKPMPQIIDEIWSKLNREKVGTSPLTERDVLLSLQPGNALDSMLNQYFGNDPLLYKQVSDGLLVKARSGGSQALADISKKKLEELGVTTPAITSLSERNARAARILQQTAPAAAGGFAASNQIAADLSIIANAMGPLSSGISALSSFFGGVAGIGNGVVGKFLGPLAGLIGFKEHGGPVDEKLPYIVGEKGPELFVPKTDGVVVPANILNRESGGGVSKGGAASTDDKKKQLYNFLVSQGLSAGGAEGVIGNLMWESGLKTSALGDKGTSFGIAQWHAGRWKALNSYASKMNMDPNSLEAQQRFLMKELNQKQYKDLLSTLKDPNTTRLQAAGDFMRIFERPKNQSASMALKRATAYDGVAPDGEYGSSSLTDYNTISSNSTSGKSLKDLLNSSQSPTGLSKLMTGRDVGAPIHNNFNVGGVSITISGAGKSSEEIAVAVRNALTDRNILTTTGSK